MLDPAVFLGEPIDFKNVCKIYPPKVKEVVSNSETQKYIMLLCQNQDDIDETIEKNKIVVHNDNPTPFDFLMINCQNNPNFTSLLRSALFFFTHEEKIYILPQQGCIYLGDTEDISKATQPSDLRCITKGNYLDFQNAIRTTLGFELEEPEPENLNPIVKRVREAAKKRRRLARKNKIKKGMNQTISLAALCCMNMGLNPTNIGDIPYASVQALITTYQKKERYDIDIKSICGGADPKKIKPKYWIRPDDDGVSVPISGIQAGKKQS